MRVLCRVERPQKRGQPWTCMLLFPDAPVSRPEYIVYYTRQEQHGEADRGYVKANCRAPRSADEKQRCAALKAHWNSINA